MHENLVHEVREINERYVDTHAVNTAVELRKNTLMYFFNEPDQVSLHFKAISALEWLQDDFTFVSVANPQPSKLQDYFISSLPAIRGALAPQTEEDDDVDPDAVK